jgi:hypothetical protein
MSTRKLTRAIQQLLQQISKTVRLLTKGIVNWLLRSLLVLGRQPLFTQAGFVLPTTVLLLLILTLTVGSIGYRTYTRSQETIGERQQRVIYNTGTPAIDRAKAKLEYMFDRQRDFRLPAGIPSEVQLLGMLYNDGRTIDAGGGSTIRVTPIIAPPGASSCSGSAPSPGCDVYTFPDEARVDLNGDGTLDNAWSYRVDANSDGTLDGTVVYSIIYSTPANFNDLRFANQAGVESRAQALQVRHGPLSNSSQQNAACTLPGAATSPDRGWIPDPSSSNTLRKNFQVDVFVQPDANNGTVSTLEFHQDREVNRGNRWGAWFRNDLEVFPGPLFNWNGAMHTEGNLIVGNSSFRGYLISSPYSCFYTKDASEVTVRQFAEDPEQGRPAFQGQWLSGKVGDNTFGDANSFDLFNGQGAAPIRNSAFNTGTDSSTGGGGGPANYALDPVILQTLDFSVGRGVPNPATYRSGGWNNTQLVQKGRMRQEEARTTPYVDDFFRADNRYGPKPRYDDSENGSFPGIPIGTDIGNNPYLTQSDAPTPDSEEQLGLDGYWERRARWSGMRLIIGQRLELGDPMGWGGPDNDLDDEPLRPWNSCPANSSGRCHEARQRTTLWDNLAAVQATAVYHSANNDKDAPLACMATTVHPGTATTLANSATFQDLAYGLPNAALGTGANAYTHTNGVRPIVSNFFWGIGTNGWEFTAPQADVTTNPAMMQALRNLANFAGDPRGGAPSFVPIQDNDVHPFPSLAMWGDFSNLRRVLGLLGSGGYNNLSPADKTTLQTAACTLGMLAYNLDYLEKFDLRAVAQDATTGGGRDLLGYPNTTTIPITADTVPTSTYNTGLRGKIRQLINGTSPLGTFPRVDLIASTASVDQPQVYVRLLERWRDNTTTPLSAAQKDEMNKIIALARMFITKEQVGRDRMWGFFTGAARYAQAPLGFCSMMKGTDPDVPGRYTISADGTAIQQIQDLADPALGANISGDPLEYLCSTRPRYPILYSLFNARDEATPRAFTGSATSPSAYDPNAIVYANFESHQEVSGRSRDSQDSANPAWAYINSSSVNRNVTYEVVRPADIALIPKRIDRSNWTLPIEAPTQGASRYQKAATGRTPNHNRDTLIKICDIGVCPNELPNPVSANLFRVAFKDAAPFNGREMMPTRMLDVNVDLIRRARTPVGQDFWLPKKGIIYAYREDSVSEREIVRPATASWGSCNSESEISTNTACRMNATGNAFQSEDPPFNPSNRITTKPVDYLPDPDRRPHGFRIKNGAEVGRTGDDGKGLSFITDNPIYLQGDFNLHQASPNSTTPLEEFTQALAADFGNFYTRNSLNSSFARANSDLWRPSELLADSISIISDNFCDGSIEDGIVSAGTSNSATITTTKRDNEYVCNSTHQRTSYLNQNRPNTNPNLNPEGIRWLRANPADSLGLPASTVANPGEGSSPIFVSRQGNPWYLSGRSFASSSFRPYGVLTAQQYYRFQDNKALMDGINNTRVNSVIISGLVPSRVNQSYGGLHNFPRFLEDWGSERALFISGSFLQLNFSNQATGPFDQDAWEPGVSTNSREDIRYYNPPGRRWGYDVGLQYAPAGPISARFVTLDAIRNEFYSEPPANDPYMRRLCLRANSSNPERCPT